jgi:hypothetical protein
MYTTCLVAVAVAVAVAVGVDVLMTDTDPWACRNLRRGQYELGIHDRPRE